MDKPHAADGTWDDNKQVNTPKLAEGMIPIKWNGENWVITTGTDPDWYNYKTVGRTGVLANQWANVMLSDGTYKSNSGLENLKDTVVQESELGSMFVWIPRYAYNIKTGYHTSTEGEIQIEFLKGTERTSSQGNTFANINGDGSIDTTETGGNDKWLVHPAFLNNTDLGGWDRELEGIWVAKFEASSSSSNIKVLPNKDSWISISIANIFKNCLDMKKDNNIYGIAKTSEPHQMKNSEWGATAYLTHSKYGRNRAEIELNDTLYTGGNNYIDNINQSTTGNIYGIYDISGGAFEYTAAGLTANITSVFGSIIEFAEKYVNRYNGSASTQSENYNYNINKYGDAIYEISCDGNSGLGAWNSDDNSFVTLIYPFFLRGGYFTSKDEAGVFAFNWMNGDAYMKYRIPTSNCGIVINV